MRLSHEILFRVIGIASVHGGGLHVLVERVPRPEHDRFQIAAGLFRPGDEVIPQLVGMAMREQAFECRVDRIDVRVFRLLEVHIRQDAAEHGREGDGALDFAPAHLHLARGAGEHFIFDGDGFKLRASQPEI